MAEDINEQLKERKAREEARRKLQTANERVVDDSQGDTKTEVSEEKEPIQNPRVRELQESLKERQNKLQDLEKQIRQLQQQYQKELLQYQNERNELNQLGGIPVRNEEPPVPNIADTETSTNTNVDANATTTTTTDTNNGRQIMTDEELARHLQAQFAREEEEALITSPDAPSSQIRTFTYGDPNSGSGFSFQISSSSTGDPMPVPDFPMLGGLTSFFDNDDMFRRPFLARSGFDRMPFPSNINRTGINRTSDPFSSMRIAPITGFPGLMFGGALMPENMDYETLMHLFPPVPRGARQEDIEQLPVDTFRVKPNEKEKDKDKTTQNSIEKKEDEFHKCCICLESFKEGDEIRRLPCLHIFHSDEISHWLERNHLCPICRTPIEQNEPNPST